MLRIDHRRERRTPQCDILDITKVWPHGEVPPVKIGKMVMNRNPLNYFMEVEQPKVATFDS